MAWADLGGAWLPAAAVLAMTVLAVGQSCLLPARAGVKLIWALAILLCGLLAGLAVMWQQQGAQAALDQQTAEIENFWSRVGPLAGLLPANPEAKPEDIFDAAANTIVALNKKVAALEGELATLKKKYNTRVIDDQTAAKMAEFLRSYGTHRVVVSCVQENVEAFTYANQIAGILRAAGWDALGPETTTIFGTGPAMGINLYVHGARVPDAARILLEAFAKFNIPYQSRVAPNAAIPDTETVELFVGAKP